MLDAKPHYAVIPVYGQKTNYASIVVTAAAVIYSPDSLDEMRHSLLDKGMTLCISL
jgi:hypothetical protein